MKRTDQTTVGGAGGLAGDEQKEIDDITNHHCLRVISWQKALSELESNLGSIDLIRDNYIVPRRRRKKTKQRKQQPEIWRRKVVG